MGESSGSNKLVAFAIESKDEITSISPSIVCELGECSKDSMEVSSIVESIEKSKSHWSQVREFGSNDEVAEVSNMEFFQTLQGHPTWGGFFMTFGEGEGSYGELVMGKKFAEGGQAELYEVQIKWNDLERVEWDREGKQEWILKVFKKGTLLQQLQLQWPQGLLQRHAYRVHRHKLGLSQQIRFYCDVYCATLLEDGRFAFVMAKEDQDLRSMINERMLTSPNDMGPFPIDVGEGIMYEIARGMDQLHSRGIVHRDIKASNVLWSRGYSYYVADFECSVGVVGTGFFRALEILEACKHGNVNEKGELFTKAVDVYGYGMTCYEILTGKLPFEGHRTNDYDLVLQGQRPKLPKYVDDWIYKLLERCWEKNPLARPSFREILEVLVANSPTCRDRKLYIERVEVELGIRKVSGMTKLRRQLKMAKLKLIRWIGRNPSYWIA